MCVDHGRKPTQTRWETQSPEIKHGEEGVLDKTKKSKSDLDYMYASCLYVCLDYISGWVNHLINN